MCLVDKFYVLALLRILFFLSAGSRCYKILPPKQPSLFLFLTVKLPTIRLVLTQSSNMCLFCLQLFSLRFVKALLNRAHAAHSVFLIVQFVSSVLAALV